MRDAAHANAWRTLPLLAARRDFAALSLAADRRQALGLFLRHLARGERIAQRIAARQIALSPDRHAARFHRAQARHEALHARLFDTFATWLSAPPLVLERCPYDRYEQRLLAAADRRDYVETIVGTQLVLEALGEASLERLDNGLERHRAGFLRLRRMLRAQEAAHHAFGEARMAAIIAGGADVRALRATALAYLALAGDVIAAGALANAHFGNVPEFIASDMRARLPAWCVEST